MTGRAGRNGVPVGVIHPAAEASIGPAISAVIDLPGADSCTINNSDSVLTRVIQRHAIPGLRARTAGHPGLAKICAHLNATDNIATNDCNDVLAIAFNATPL